MGMQIPGVIIVILLIMWIGGLLLQIAGKLIHILLVIAVIALIIRFIRKI